MQNFRVSILTFTENGFCKFATRSATLATDGFIVYDIQDEGGRTTIERPFPFRLVVKHFYFIYIFIFKLQYIHLSLDDNVIQEDHGFSAVCLVLQVGVWEAMCSIQECG